MKFCSRIGILGIFVGLALTSSLPAKAACPLQIEQAYKHKDASTVFYITTDCTKRAFKRSDIFFTYFDSFDDVVTVSKSLLDDVSPDPLGFMPWGPSYDPKYGALVKIVKDPKVYLLLGTERYWITSEAVFNGLNYQWNWIEDVDPRLLDAYAVGSEINYTDHHPNYTIVKYADSPRVYRLEPDPANAGRQVKRHIPDEDAFSALTFRWDRIVTIPLSEQYADGPPMEEESQLAAWRTFALDHINQIRADHGVVPLVMNEELNEIAQRHSDDMALYIQAMSHMGSLGEQPDERIEQGKVPNVHTRTFEYILHPENVVWSGENVGMRNTIMFDGDVERAIVNQHEWFMDEPDGEYNHRTTMLSSMAPFTEIGIGMTLDENSNLWITEDYISY